MANTPVSVLSGHWVCDADGMWDFIFSLGTYGKTVNVDDVRCFRDLQYLVTKEFNIDETKEKLSLTFWSPDVSLVVSQPGSAQLRVPPVSITSDSGVAQFLSLLNRRPDTNLYLTVEDVDTLKTASTEDDNVDLQQPQLTLSQSSMGDESFLQMVFNVEAELKRKLDEQSAQGCGGRGEPTLEPTPAGSSEQVACESQSSKKAKGKGIYVGEPVGFDLGIEELDVSMGDESFLQMVFNVEAELKRKLDEQSAQGCGGRGEPTLEPTPAGSSEQVACESQSSKKAKGKGIYVGEPVGFDLGIEELDVGCHVNQPYRTSENLNIEQVTGEPPNTLANLLIDQLSAEDFTDPPPELTYLPQPEDSSLVYIGRVFPNKKEFHLALSMLALQQFFCYKVTHSNKARINVNCVDTACKWHVYAKGFIDSESYEITKYIPLHTCGVTARSRYVEKATSKVIAQLLNPKFSNGKPGPRAHQIPDVVLSELKVSISYMKAWYAKEAAVANARGKEEENFRLLSEYLRALMSSNPGSLTELEYSSDSMGNRHFKYLFVAFGAAISGWPYVRKVVGIDGTQLKGKYKGCLLAASCQDGNMQILPLAFGVVDSENDESWSWFLDNLTQIVDDDERLVFVSDRHKSIRSAVKQVFPNSVHLCCVVHLVRNVKHLFKCSGLASMVNMAARAFTKTDFRYWWNQIQNISPECAKYLVEAGFARWSRAHFEGDRYNLMSSNICESLNHALGPAVEFPIITLVEYLRTMLMRWFAERREESLVCRTMCTPTVEKLLVDYLKLASDLKVLPASRTIFQVNDTRGLKYTVDLLNKTCTCNAFQKLKIPCIHAMAARSLRGVDVYSLVDEFYYTANWANIYRSVVMPVPDTRYDEAEVGEDGGDLNPPKTRRPGGRPRSKRVPSTGECHYSGTSRQTRCGRCSEFGHNRATCKNPI